MKIPHMAVLDVKMRKVVDVHCSAYSTVSCKGTQDISYS